MHEHDEDDNQVREEEDLVEDDKQKPAKRRRTDIGFIADRSKRNVCFTKRKKGLLKKATELRRLTGCQIFICVASDDEVHMLTSEKLAQVLANEDSRSVFESSLGLENKFLRDGAENPPDENGNVESQHKIFDLDKQSRKRPMQGELPPPKKQKLDKVIQEEKQVASPPKSATPAPPTTTTSNPPTPTILHAPTTPALHPTFAECNDPFYTQSPIRHPRLAFVHNPMGLYLPPQQQESQLFQTIFTKPLAPATTNNVMHTIDATALYSPPQMMTTTFAPNSTLNVMCTPLDLKLNVEQDLVEKWNQNLKRA